MAKQPSKGKKAPAKSSEPAQSPEIAVESPASTMPRIDVIPVEIYPKPAKLQVEDTPPTPEPEPVVDTTEAQPRPEPAAVAPKQKKNGGFLPLLIGGLLAGAAGFAAATLTTQAQSESGDDAIAIQAAEIAALEQRISGLEPVDVGSINETQIVLQDQLNRLSDRLGQLEARVDDLSNRPTETTVTTDTGDEIEVDLDALRAEIAQMTEAAQAELATARAEAAAIEENAAMAARNAAGRAALARIQSAMETGAPIGAALNDLEASIGRAAPDGLQAARDGVPSLSVLQEGFPDAARAALAIARSEGVAGEELTGFGAFLRNQFDVRSTQPREGVSTDAVLSRAESALRAGRLADALAEINALPEVARAQMSDWLVQAETRAAALDAIDALNSSLTDN